jgi:hypothetical protein
LFFYSPKFQIICFDRPLSSLKAFESIERGVLSGEAEGDMPQESFTVYALDDEVNGPDGIRMGESTIRKGETLWISKA